MSKALLVTGTDTDVGKTVAAALIAGGLRKRGLNIGVLKPAESDCKAGAGGELVAKDATLLTSLSGDASHISEIVPYRFEPAVAPSVAAAAENVEVDTDGIVDLINQRAKEVDLLIVEGAGGLLVPIVDNYTIADLAKEAELSTLVVVASKLGALNHSALTFESLRGRGIETIGYVFNNYLAEPSDELDAFKSNREVLRGIAEQYSIVEIGYLEKLPSAKEAGLKDFLENEQVTNLVDNILAYLKSRTG